MNSIEKITLRITKEAEDYAEDTIQKARERAEAIISDAKKKAEEIRNAKNEKACLEGNAIINRAASSADILERNILLDAKSVIIDGIYEKAEAAVAEMDGERYLSFLTASLSDAISFLASSEDCSEDDEETEKTELFLLTLNKKDKKLFGKKLITFASGLIKETGRKIELSDSCGDFSGGLKLQLGTIEANLTLSALIKASKEETESSVYGILFR